MNVTFPFLLVLFIHLVYHTALQITIRHPLGFLSVYGVLPEEARLPLLFFLPFFPLFRLIFSAIIVAINFEGLLGACHDWGTDICRATQALPAI